jgi:hypothetical protein
MVDRYRYLVIGQWDNDDNKNPYIAPDGKKYDHPTRMFSIDIQNNKIKWRESYDGYSHGYCDGGIINGNKEAFFFGLGGVTYHLDYGADKFQHEELLGTTKRIAEGTARGSRAIRLIGNHFYSAYSGNQIHRRDAAKEWTLLSDTPREYCNKLGTCSVEALDGFSENEIYFSGKEGNLWYYNGKVWEKLFGLPKDQSFNYLVCGDDGKVYVVDTLGGVAIGKHNKFTYFPMKEDDPASGGILFDVTHYKGKLYMARHSLYEFKEGHWVEANVPGIYGGVEHLASKDGMLFIGTPYSLKIYNGKETFTLYGEAKEDAMLVTKGLLEVSADLLEKGNALIDEIDKQRI